MNPYNAVQYATQPKPQTHPDHVGALAHLYGMLPAPATRCRVLEMGCGSGGNLIAMAVGLPESEFVGIDLATDPIEEGNRSIAALGLRNIQLRAMDVMDVTASFGSFDYIIAFGLFSWVPDFVRRKMLSICAEQLAPQGVAYINYNAYPGFHIRSLVRDLMRFHISGIADPDEALGQAFAIAETVLGTGMGEDEYGKALYAELKETQKHPRGGVFHDTLAAENTAFYFHEFEAMAREHGLQYLAEAEFFTMQANLYGERVREALQPFAGDRVRQEQYLDFLRGRRFRQTLLCHAAVTLDPEPNRERMRDLFFSCPVRPDEEGRFKRAIGVPVKPVHPMASAALLHLADAWPRRLRFEEVLAVCEGHGGADMLAEILLGGYSVGLLEVHAGAPQIAITPGPRPLASALARLQFADDSVAVNLHHKLIKIEEEDGRRLIGMLDGTRDRAELAREFGIDEQELEDRLRTIARVALLVE